MANLLIKQLKQNGKVFLPVTAAEAIATKWTFKGDTTAKTESLAAVLDDLKDRIAAGSVTMKLEGTPVEGTVGTAAAALPVKNDDGDKDAALVLRNANDEIISFVDASAFLIDGVLSTVEIVTEEVDGVEKETNKIKFTWNADSGKTATIIDFEKIFGDELDALVATHTEDVSVINASITGINGRLDGLDTSVSANTAAIEEAVAQHTEDVSVINASITGINGRLDGLDASVAALEAFKDGLTAEEVALTADYTVADGTTGEGATVKSVAKAGDSVQDAVAALDAAVVELKVANADGIQAGNSKESTWAEGSTDFIVAAGA